MKILKAVKRGRGDKTITPTVFKAEKVFLPT